MPAAWGNYFFFLESCHSYKIKIKILNSYHKGFVSSGNMCSICDAVVRSNISEKINMNEKLHFEVCD